MKRQESVGRTVIFRGRLDVQELPQETDCQLRAANRYSHSLEVCRRSFGDESKKQSANVLLLKASRRQWREGC